MEVIKLAYVLYQAHMIYSEHDADFYALNNQVCAHDLVSGCQSIIVL